MYNYYSTIRDNFFSNPDMIRDYALSLDYSECGVFPGVRTGHFINSIKSFFIDLVINF